MLLCAALLLAFGTAAADVEELIARCAASDSDDARIACLERALREQSGTPGPAPEPRRTAPGSTAAAGVAAAEAPTAAAEAPASAPSAGELGAEQVRSRARGNDDEGPRVRATVVDHRFVGYRRLMVQLDNGQVWQQIDGDRTSVERGLRDAGTFEVEMWATKLGGYRMRILSLERTIRVERLR